MTKPVDDDGARSWRKAHSAKTRKEHQRNDTARDELKRFIVEDIAEQFERDITIDDAADAYHEQLRNEGTYE